MTLFLLYVLDSTNDIKNVLFENAEVFYVFDWSVIMYVLQKKCYFKIVLCTTSGKVVDKMRKSTIPFGCYMNYYGLL